MTPYLLNLLDLALTLYALDNGGVELNPLMRCVPFMVAYKVGAVGVLCYLLHHFRERTKLIQWGLNLCTVVYGALCIYHLIFIGGAFLWQSILPAT